MNVANNTGLFCWNADIVITTTVGWAKNCLLVIEKDWNTPLGQTLVVKWSKVTGFAENSVLKTMAAFRASI